MALTGRSSDQLAWLRSSDDAAEHHRHRDDEPDAGADLLRASTGSRRP